MVVVGPTDKMLVSLAVILLLEVKSGSQEEEKPWADLGAEEGGIRCVK